MAVMDQVGKGDRALAGGLALLGGLVVISQLILANEYLYRPGNVERYFPLLPGSRSEALGI